MIDNILSETICHFCSCALFLNIYSKINFIAKNGSDLGNFIVFVCVEVLRPNEVMLSTVSLPNHTFTGQA